MEDNGLTTDLAKYANVVNVPDAAKAWSLIWFDNLL